MNLSAALRRGLRRKRIGLLVVPLEDLYREYAPRARVPLSLGTPLLSASERVETVECGAVRLYGLQGEMCAVYVHQHCVVSRPGAGCQRALARRVEPPSASPAHHVGHPLYRHGALVDVVVTCEDQVHLVPRKDRYKICPHPLIAAVPGGAVGRSVQKCHLPALARGGQVALQERLLMLRASALVAVVQFAVEGNEMGISPVEGVVAFGATRAAEGWVEVLEEGGAVYLSHVVVAEDGVDGNLLDELPVRCEEAPVVVSLLTCRIDHVAHV